MTFNVMEEVKRPETMAYFGASIITSKSWLCTLNCSQPFLDPFMLQPLSVTIILLSLFAMDSGLIFSLVGSVKT